MRERERERERVVCEIGRDSGLLRQGVRVLIVKEGDIKRVSMRERQ